MSMAMRRSILQASLDLRGFAAGRYLDNTSVTAHAEWRYKFLPRWGAIAFVETGKVGASRSELDDGENITSVGLGFRWQVLESKNIQLGIDYAKSEDDNAIYLRVGESF